MDQEPEYTEPVAGAEAPQPEADASEAAKIAQFEELVAIPDWCKDVFEWMDEDAKYIAEDCIYAAEDDEHSTSTNYILRNQFVLISQIYARDPTARIQPAPMMGQHPPGLMEFSKTLEILSKKLTVEAGFKSKLGGAIQDVQTYGIAWLKVTTQTDLAKDPLGAARQNDQLDNIARLKSLMEGFQNGDFDQDSPEYADLADLSDTVRQYLAGNIREDVARNPPSPVSQIDEMGQETLVPDPMDPRLGQLQQLEDPAAQLEPTVLPEVPTFIGVNIDAVMPQDIRFDWSITRPEDFYNAQWVAHRVYMSKDEITMRWNMPDDEWDVYAETCKGKKMRRPKGGSDDPSTRGSTDEKSVNDTYAVWEFYDKPTGRRYVWLEGCKRFFINEVLKHSWHKFFPFFPLVFNRVTGRFLPMSDVRLQRPLQEEINTKRTHEREACAAAYPRYIVAAGALEPEEAEKLENARPFSVIEIKRPDDVKKFFENIASEKPDPSLYDISKAVREIEISAGVTQNAAGGVGGATFATEAAIANEQMAVQSDRRKTLIEDLIHDVNECVVELSLQLFPEENVKALVGPGAVWPLIDREHMWRQLHVVIEPGMSGKPDEAKLIQKWTGWIGMMASIGLVVNPIEVGRKITEELNLGIDFTRFIIDPAMVAAVGATPGNPSGPGVPGKPPEPSAKPPGAGPGAPPIADRPQGPPDPGQVNNRPTGKTP